MTSMENPKPKFFFYSELQDFLCLERIRTALWLNQLASYGI